MSQAAVRLLEMIACGADGEVPPQVLEDIETILGGTVASAATKTTTGSGVCGSGASVLSAATKETEGASSGAGGAWAHGEDAGVFYMNEGLPAGGETPGDDWPEGEVERSGWVGE